MNPHAIRFSQSSITYYFRDGTSIDELADSLRAGRTRPDDVPALRLVEKEGVYYTLDNRRLEAFRRANVEIPWRMADPEEVISESWKFTTTNEGASVHVRGEVQ